jgi:ABC-type glycerol-3-phosphate transport system permease component
VEPADPLVVVIIAACRVTLAVPFGILIMRSFMLGVPTSIVEAARVEGPA